MVYSKITIGEEEKEVLLELSLEGAALKKQRMIFKVLMIILGAFLVILAFLQKSITYGIMGLIVIVAAIFAVQIFQKKGVKAAYKKMDKQVAKGKRPAPGERTYTINENGIDIDSALGHVHNNWDAFIHYGTKSHYTWIQRKDNQVILLDHRKVPDEKLAELNELLKNIKQ